MRHRELWGGIGLAAALLWAGGHAAAAAPINIQLIAEHSDAGVPSINDLGQIAFFSKEGGPLHFRLFDGVQSRPVIGNSAVDSISGSPIVNNATLVAVTQSNHLGIDAWDSVDGERRIYNDWSATLLGMNNLGTMTLITYDAQGTPTVSTGNGGPKTPVKTYPGQVRPALAPISDTGSIALYETDHNQYRALRLIENGVEVFSREVQTEPGAHGLRLSTPDLTPAGALYFGYGQLAGSESPSIWRYLDGTLTEAIKGAFATKLAANDAGTVVWMDELTMAIQVSEGTTVERIIGQGDALFGSTVQAFDIGPNAINAAGEITFFAFLTDGRYVVAKTQAVPEPATATASTILLTATLARRRAKHLAQ